MSRYLLLSFYLLATMCRGQGFTINTIAGDGVQGFAGDTHAAVSAEISALAGLAVDAAGNVYIADTGNCRIRKVAINGTITTVAGDATPGYSGDLGPATSASLSFPRGVTVDTAGNIYIADSENYVIRKVDTNGIITTIAGTGTMGFSGDGLAAVNAQISDVAAVASDAAGNLYFADRTNNRIRMIGLDRNISTVAGTGAPGFTGEGGPAIKANLYRPSSVAFDAAGTLYFAEPSNSVVRKMSRSGIITTVLGQGGMFTFAGDGGLATNAVANDPQGAAVDSAGNIFVTDEDNQRIRMISPGGIVTTIAGDGNKNFSGDGGPSTSAEIQLPAGIAVGPTGVVYFVDAGNKRVRALVPAAYGQPPSITNGGVVSASAFGQFTVIAPGDWIEIYGSNLAQGTNTWASSNFNGIYAPTSLNGTSVTIGNVPAFVQYADPGHINAQVASNVGAGPQELIVTTAAGVSAAYTVTVNAASPGLLAPPAFVIGGQRYVAALFSDGATFVLPPGAIPGVASRRAVPGDIITLYGVGFGAVAPAIPAGQIVQQTNSLLAGMQVAFDQTPATLTYAGLAVGAVGLYQFNVVVPNLPASDSTLLTFTLGGAGGRQNLLIAVQ